MGKSIDLEHFYTKIAGLEWTNELVNECLHLPQYAQYASEIIKQRKGVQPSDTASELEAFTLANFSAGYEETQKGGNSVLRKGVCTPKITLRFNLSVTLQRIPVLNHNEKKKKTL